MTKSESLQLLMARLDCQDVAWDDVEDLLDEFPGWLSLVRALRYPVRPMDNRIVWGPVQSEFTQMSEKDRLRLLEFFRPFLILLNAELTPQQRVEALQNAGTNPTAFCKEHQNDAIQEICENADLVLEALAAGRTLLRSNRRSHEPEQLLRQLEDLPPEPHLHPAENETQTASTRPNWLRRILKR